MQMITISDRHQRTAHSKVLSRRFWALMYSFIHCFVEYQRSPHELIKVILLEWSIHPSSGDRKVPSQLEFMFNPFPSSTHAQLSSGPLSSFHFGSIGYPKSPTKIKMLVIVSGIILTTIIMSSNAWDLITLTCRSPPPRSSSSTDPLIPRLLFLFVYRERSASHAHPTTVIVICAMYRIQYIYRGLEYIVGTTNTKHLLSCCCRCFFGRWKWIKNVRKISYLFDMPRFLYSHRIQFICTPPPPTISTKLHMS